MDAKFHPAMAAIKAGNIEALKSTLAKDPSLATARSSRSHPTLLQCLALEAVDVPNDVEMAQVLIDAGADVNQALGAAACIDNVAITELLLDRGAPVEGTGSWSPLEEALYWNNKRVIRLLLARGASVRNLRIASALGRVDVMKTFFDKDGKLKPEAGKIDWPFGAPKEGKFTSKIKQELEVKFSKWSDDPGDIINNALVYAAMHNQIEAVRFLIEHGAKVNEIPPGFDYSGGALHYAALNGHREMVDFLIASGADVKLKDTKVNSTASGWANHGGHKELAEYLQKLEQDDSVRTNA